MVFAGQQRMVYGMWVASTLWCIHFEATPLPFSLPSSLYSPQIFLFSFSFLCQNAIKAVFQKTHLITIPLRPSEHLHLSRHFDGVCFTIKFNPPAIYLNISIRGMTWYGRIWRPHFQILQPRLVYSSFFAVIYGNSREVEVYQQWPLFGTHAI